jgi:cytochrome c biogenesis protein CcmG, thiol:disulfide interchange protein DsbE
MQHYAHGVKRNAVPLVAILAVAALVGLLVYGVASKGEDRTIEDAIANGDRPAAPSRALPVLGEQQQRSLESFKGRPVVLNFWASWCTPCKDEAPLLERAQARLERLGGTVLGVTYRDASADSQAFIRRFKLSYPNVRDVEGQLAKDYGTRALPETFVIDRDGRVADVRRGVVDREFLDAALTKVGA